MIALFIPSIIVLFIRILVPVLQNTNTCGFEFTEGSLVGYRCQDCYAILENDFEFSVQRLRAFSRLN